ncbi:MAG TPA: hypothetical protein VK638_28665 [Edaphobacter sp.]|nr:hypothetical protein [Edaphobacter sp.]
MTKAILVLVETGVVLGIIVAALALPPSTPLFAFVVIGAIVFIIGNGLLFASIRVSKRSTGNNPGFWMRILKVYGISVAAWLCWPIARR